MALASLALLPWGAAAFVLGAGATPAQAGIQYHFEDHDLFMLVEQDGQTYFVRMDLFVFGMGTAPISEEEIAAAKADYLSRFPNAVELTEGEVAAQYATSGFKWTANTTSWGYNNAGAAAGVSGSASSAMTAGAAVWNTAGSNFSFTGGFASGAGTGACGGGTDGSNTVGWAAQSGSVLAVTCTWYNSGGGGFASAVEFDMQFDPDWTWTTGLPITIDLQSVATHEFGHALGLNHSGSGAAVMYASYGSGSDKRSLTADDISGVQFIYGTPGGPTNTPTPAPTNTPSGPTNTPTPTGTPTNTSTPGGPTSTPTPFALPTSTPFGQPTSTPFALPTSTPFVPPANTPVPPTATPRPGTPESGAPTSTPATTATPTSAPSATATATPKPTLPIVPGSNLLAWPGTNLPPAQALGSQAASLRIVYEWDPVTGEWKRWAPNLPSFVNNLALMKTGVSYWFIGK